MKNAILILAALTLTAAAGLLHGQATNRWGAAPEIGPGTARLLELPEQIGGWQLEESFQPKKNVLQILQCENYLHRRYYHRETGDTAELCLILGSHGPLSVHSPEICYSGQGYEPMAEREKLVLSDGDEFWITSLRSRETPEDTIQVYFGWSTGAAWEASSWPRWTYRTTRYLYKSQLVCRPAPGSGRSAADVARGFLQDFAPAAKPYLLHQTM